MKYDVIVVGGGIAGLTAAAFLCKSGHKVLLCEKEDHVGGLVGSFVYNGFTFDSGIRAMENSGILFPMLKQLGLSIEFRKNPVSIGIAQDIETISSVESLPAYQKMLVHQFPNEQAAIAQIMEIVKKSMSYMDVLYGIDNPMFLDLKNDTTYVRKTLLPWLFQYLATAGKIKSLNVPVEAYLKTITQNQALIDLIAQHFFVQTPASFALSYFSLYLDYNYPKGGTGALITALADYITKNGGTIQVNAQIKTVNPVEKNIVVENGDVHTYDELIWTADNKALYASLHGTDQFSRRLNRKIQTRAAFLSDKKGGDSVLTLYLTTALDKSYFEGIHTPHFFYTPAVQGLSTLPVSQIKTEQGAYSGDKEAAFAWMQAFLRLTTYEIAVPVMRDASLAPEGKTGLIISTLMDYSLVQHIAQQGWYNELKQLCQDTITAALIDSVYPALEGEIIDAFVATPLTIQSRTGNTDGAITGWAFTNDTVPAISSMSKIMKSVQTPIPNVSQAGQWTYSPSGFPISILTGKIAADTVSKKLKR